jgi:Sec-independent protein translocase protein TatA
MERVYRRRVLLLLLLLLALLLFGAALIPPAVRWIGRTIAGVHQRGITKELADWSMEYGRVETLSEAKQAIDMLGYIEQYYVPGEGYRSNPKIEAALEAQRKKTIEAIVRALQAYSGQDIGNDREAWENWLKRGWGKSEADGE